MDIYLGSDQLNSNKRFCLQDKGLFAPNFTFTSVANSGRLGRTLSSPLARSYTITTEWLILGTDHADLETERQNFISSLGEILIDGVKDFRIDTLNGKSLYIPVRSFRVTGSTNPADGVSCPLLVEFEAEYPFLRSVTEYIDEVNIFSGGGFAIPFSIPFDMSVGGSAEKVVLNNGTFNSFPILTFYGIMENPTLINSALGKSMSLQATLSSSSDFITVDTFTRSVIEYPSGNSVRGKFSGDFFTLKKGENPLKLTASSGTSGKVVIRHRDHLIGK